MFHPLQQKIVRLRRRVRRMTAVYGLSIAGAALLGAMAALGWIDYLVRFQDRGLRIFASIALLAAIAWSLYRYVITPLWARLRDADLAARVQRRFPNLGDRLLSAVEFLSQVEDNPTAGSPSLRRAVVAQTTTETERLDFCDALDPRPAVRAVLLLATASLVVGMFVVLDPPASQIAVARLVNPFNDAAWPRVTHLAVCGVADPVARGTAFQIEVYEEQGALLPPDVRIHYRFDGPEGVAVEETERMRYVGGAMTARRENVVRPFSYRVEGGDDQSMTWRDVHVVEPPAVESVSVRLIPPPYTGWPTAPAEQQIRALVGTRVQIAAHATKPLKSATLCLDGATNIPARLNDDASTFAAEFTVEKSGSYWFELVDRDGLTGGNNDHWEIRAIPDAPPTMTIEQPNANLFVTPRAVLPIRVEAKDDLALSGVALVVRRGDSATEETLPLWTSAGPAASPARRKDNEMPQPDRRTINYPLNLGPLELKPGAQVTFYATAADFLPQGGKSESRSLTVISAEQLQERITGREKLILAELERALKMQRGCRTQLDAVASRLAQQKPIDQAAVDLLQALQHSQLEAERVLTGRELGVPGQVMAMLADLENNGASAGDVQQRMAALLAEIERLRSEHLPAIDRELTAAVKSEQVVLEGQGGQRQSDSQVPMSLAVAAKHQDAVIAAIDRMMERLSQWDSYRRFLREFSQLLRDQGDVARRTSTVGRRTLTQNVHDLGPQDVAELSDAAGRQLELARLLDRLLQQMDLSGGELRQSDPAEAKAVADALDQARRLTVDGQMRATGQQIERNQIGQAAAGQKQITRDLQKVLETLANRSRQAETGQSQTAQSPVPDGTSATKAGLPSGGQPPEESSAARAPGSAGNTKSRRPDTEAVRSMMKQLWGQLPEHTRQQMLQSPIEEFPPKYEEMIEDYFRRLSEDKTDTSNGRNER